MEKHYTAYIKEIAGEKFYFVKAFTSFPELGLTSQLLNGYGMHKDFNEACSIAGITDLTIKKQLIKTIRDVVPQAIVIDINDAVQLKRMTL